MIKHVCENIYIYLSIQSTVCLCIISFIDCRTYRHVIHRFLNIRYLIYHIISRLISYHPIENIIHCIYFHTIYDTDVHPYMYIIDTATCHGYWFHPRRVVLGEEADDLWHSYRHMVPPSGLVVLKGTGMGHQFAPRNCEN